MRYAKKRDSDVDWQLDEERSQERQVRVRRREGPSAPKLTRKMAKVDARLLAMSRADYQDPVATVKPPPVKDEAPPLSKRAVQPPPLPIPFPFPFANGAGSGQMPLVLANVTSPREDSLINVHDSWLLPPPDSSGRINLRSVLPAAASAEGTNRINIRSLVPREPDPFSIMPPKNFSLPPR